MLTVPQLVLISVYTLYEGRNNYSPSLKYGKYKKRKK